VLAFVMFLGQAGFLHAAEDEAALRKKALELNRVTGVEPIKGNVLTLSKDADGSKKLLALAVRMTKEKPQPFSINATLILATVAENLKEYDASETFYRLHGKQALEMGSIQEMAQTYAGMIQLFYDSKQFDKVEKVCREFLGIEGEESVERLKPVVVRRLILALAKQGSFDKAHGILDKLIEAQPENWLNIDLKARVLREAGKIEESVKVYLDIIERIKKDTRLKKEEQEDFISDYRYALSGLYVDLKKIDKAADELKALLAKEPDNPTYNNDLGYIWADHDMNLAESEKLIRKAIDEDRKQRRKANPDLKPEQDKDTAAYLDSLAWVLYKQKKYKEAKPHLLQAIEDEEGRHIEIYDHLGDVCLALGEKAAAVDAWKKGLKAVGTTKRDLERKAEVEKKLKANE
jgi:tetratricopeptide (TPR) repeat protein